MLRGWARHGDPESQASASEVGALWNMVSGKLLPSTAAALVPARAAVSNHKLLLRIHKAPTEPMLALQHSRDLRDSFDEAVSDMTFRDLPFRVSIELSPQRRERLRAFFQAQDDLTDHLRLSGIAAEFVPCVQSLRLHGPKRHVLGSLTSSGSWSWRSEAFIAEGLRRPSGDGPHAGPSAGAGAAAPAAGASASSS